MVQHLTSTVLILANSATRTHDADNLPLADYVAKMPLDREVIDLVGDTALNNDLLDPNAIPAERKDLWDEGTEDDDRVIVRDARPDVPVSTPAPEILVSDDPPHRMQALLTAEHNMCELYVPSACHLIIL